VIDIDWRSRATWQRIGVTLTAAWMIGVLVVTENDVTHPLFDYIFRVPLVGWAVGIAVGYLIQRTRAGKR